MAFDGLPSAFGRGVAYVPTDTGKAVEVPGLGTICPDTGDFQRLKVEASDLQQAKELFIQNLSDLVDQGIAFFRPRPEAEPKLVIKRADGRFAPSPRV